MAAGTITMVDPDFGALKYRVDAWDGRSPFTYEPSRTTHFAVQILAPQSGPTSAQQAVYRDLKTHYAELWPAIAQKLIECSDGVTNVDELREALNPVVGLYMLEEFDDPSLAEFELVYDLNRPNEESRACFVRLKPWEVLEVVAAD